MKRRTFIKKSGLISTVTVLSSSAAFASKANSAVNIGIIGCGGRGTRVLSSMSDNANINILAMADLFEDRLSTSRKVLSARNVNKGLPEIQDSNTYIGSKAYLRLLERKDIEAVLISSPAYTHAGFLEAAVDAGKHVYCEKPAAPDVDGCLRVERAGRKANGKLSIAIGFQIRYATPYVEMVKRIQQGDIGEILSAQLYYLSSGKPVRLPEGISADEARIRYHYNWLAMSGGCYLDQIIHIIDVCNWALQKRPIYAMGLGGKDDTLTYGDVWRHFQVIYQYPGINVTAQATQYGPYAGDVCAKFIGTKGAAQAHYTGGVYITGEKPWDSGVRRYGAQQPTAEERNIAANISSLYDSDKNKGSAFIKSIETGSYLNEALSGAESTLSAMLGREAAMMGKTLSWDELRLSGHRLDPGIDLSQFDKTT